MGQARPRLRRARHARLGAGARGSGRGRDRVRRRDRRARRCAADPCRRAARPGPRRRPLRLAQPTGVQRRQVLRRGGPQARRRRRGGGRGASRRSGRRAEARSRRPTTPPTATSSTSLEHFGTDLHGLRIAVDCANGAYSAIAPGVFERLGADVTTVAATPDGSNINVGCGATDLGLLQESSQTGGYDLGVAFDGDGDRMLAVDEIGSCARRRPDPGSARARTSASTPSR